MGLIAAGPALAEPPADLRVSVDAAIRPLMEEFDIPGVALGVIMPKENYVFHYGVASRETGRPVDDATLFEIGSVSKTYSAVLAGYAAQTGRLAFSDPVTRHLPALAGTALDRVTLADLGTHASGGMPLQVPDGLREMAQLTGWLRDWKPAYEPGTVRTYSNVSIGLFGLAAAASLGSDFATLMEGTLFPALGLRDTFLAVPDDRRNDYALGTTRDGKPARLSPGLLAREAYSIRTSAPDLLRFIELNMGRHDLPEPWRRAILATHTGYDQLGPMVQGIVWEEYDDPARLEDLLAINSSRIALEPQPVRSLDPPRPPRSDVLINKTGSTNGFGTYVAFVPARGIGVVLLANRNIPNETRVQAVHAILKVLDRSAEMR